MKLKDLEKVLRGEYIYLKWKDGEFKEHIGLILISDLKYLDKEVLDSEILRIDLDDLNVSNAIVFIRIERDIKVVNGH